jgi:hypothetical protein
MAHTVGEVKEVVKRALRITNATDEALVVSRIKANALELCRLWPWPELRARGAALPSDALGVVSCRDANGRPFWYMPDAGDYLAGDLDGHNVYSLHGATLSAYAWNGTGWTASSPTMIEYWMPPACASSTAENASVGLPSVRALTARVVADLIGTMDRKEADAAAWRSELNTAMRELELYRTPPQGPVLRTRAGRRFWLSPVHARGPLAAAPAPAAQPQGGA